ncbi:MAG: ABC transporter permease [Clostridia bacterium]|jgi:ABC-type dipeptide/oligopeptide/nickel transport system permease subunit|nr:ABC transporter permease [Clostridia bacterium]
MTTVTKQTNQFSSQAPSASGLWRFLRVFLGRKVVIFGTVIILGLIITAIFAPQLAPHDPYQQNLRSALQQPSEQHLLGTDQLGRDILSRIIYGARVSLTVGFVSVGIGSLLGMTLGLLSGFFGGFIDSLIMRLIDAIMAIPPLLLALALGAAMGGGLQNVMISLGIALIPGYARLMRGQVLTVKQMDYVKAGEVIGSSDFRIMLRHILPNCMSPLIVLVTLNLGVAILAEAGLSFLGLGISPPGAAWGAMVSDGYRYLLNNPLLSFAPGICIMLVVLAFNLVGDGLRDALDPRLRGTL